jgi:hypothetical protein
MPASYKKPGYLQAAGRAIPVQSSKLVPIPLITRLALILSPLRGFTPALLTFYNPFTPCGVAKILNLTALKFIPAFSLCAAAITLRLSKLL